MQRKRVDGRVNVEAKVRTRMAGGLFGRGDQKKEGLTSCWVVVDWKEVTMTSEERANCCPSLSRYPSSVNVVD